MTDLLITNDGRSPSPEKDCVIGVEPRKSLKVSGFKCKGILL